MARRPGHCLSELAEASAACLKEMDCGVLVNEC